MQRAFVSQLERRAFRYMDLPYINYTKISMIWQYADKTKKPPPCLLSVRGF